MIGYILHCAVIQLAILLTAYSSSVSLCRALVFFYATRGLSYGTGPTFDYALFDPDSICNGDLLTSSTHIDVAVVVAVCPFYTVHTESLC